MNAATNNDGEMEIEVKTPAALMTATMRAELDHEVTTARAYPRSVKRFMSQCRDLACLSTEVAESCLYALPRGGKTIEGASARFAEILQSSWGNCRAGARVVEEGDEFVTAEGVFYDLEHNSKITMQVKRRITDKEGRRFNSDMIAVTGNAAASIAHRNAVLKGVPKAYWNPIYLEAKKTAIGSIKSLANKRAELLEWLQKRHVSQEMALAALGVEGVEDIGEQEMGVLIAAISAIKNGESTIEAAFAPKGGVTGTPKAKKPPTETPKAKAAKKAAPSAEPQPTAVSDDQVTVLLDKLKEEGVSEPALCAKFEVGAVAEIPKDKFDAALAAIDELSK